MKRDLARLAASTFDIAVIGGGIHGLAVAYDAAQRGLSVALLERGDFGGATSFNHLKTLHGGLRYLQHADFFRMRESVRERRAFARIAPRFVSPLAFVMPTRRSLTGNGWSLKAAFAIDALVGGDRNRGIDPEHRLPSARLISGGACHALFGDLWPDETHNGAMWCDYEIVQSERLTLSFALAAASHGAALANYVEASAVSHDRTWARVRALDRLGAENFEVRAKIVINAAGPWIAGVLAQSGIERTWPLIKAMNIVTSRPAPAAALVRRAKSGRALVLLPWQGRTLVGTSESAAAAPADDQSARRGEVQGFLSDVNATFSGLDLRDHEITFVHRGVVPAKQRRGRLTLLGHSTIVDHVVDGRGDLISIVGVKYTTARAVAERTVDLVFTKLGRPHVSCLTANATLPSQSSAADAVPRDSVRHAVDREMAHTLTDVIVRRTALGAAGYPGDGVARQYCAEMQRVLGWSAARAANELASLARFYNIE